MNRRYDVKLPPGEVLACLAGGVDPDGLFGAWGSGNRPLHGRVANNTFEIKLRTETGGSFKPVLYGRVNGTPEGSSIHVKVGMNSFTPAFMLIWLAGTVGFQVHFLLAFLFGEQAFRGGRRGPFRDDTGGSVALSRGESDVPAGSGTPAGARGSTLGTPECGGTPDGVELTGTASPARLCGL